MEASTTALFLSKGPIILILHRTERGQKGMCPYSMRKAYYACVHLIPDVLPEKQMFPQGESGRNNSEVVLSCDAKPRLKWTPQLHERFIEAVNQLGGANKATPKSVLKVMGIQGLTLYHLKSHLQKYRISKNLCGQPNDDGANKISLTPQAKDRMDKTNGINTSISHVGPQTNKNLHINEALQMQTEVQRRLHEQLEVQRHLQLRIEAQGKYLEAVLEKAQETVRRQNLGAVGREDAKVQLSELVSKVSTLRTLNSAFSGMKDADCSIDSCLTFCEGQQTKQDMIGLNFLNSSSNAPLEFKKVEGINRNNGFLSSSDLSMSDGHESSEWNATRSNSEERFTMDQVTRRKTEPVRLENLEPSQKLRLLYFEKKPDAVLSPRPFDLNGLSW
ncbi:hypothetical protein L1887_07590 [Cichorium endivia]|nr:hypothetical protein L1887_07590 [Cichorium endivia]